MLRQIERESALQHAKLPSLPSVRDLPPYILRSAYTTVATYSTMIPSSTKPSRLLAFQNDRPSRSKALSGALTAEVLEEMDHITKRPNIYLGQSYGSSLVAASRVPEIRPPRPRDMPLNRFHRLVHRFMGLVI